MLFYVPIMLTVFSVALKIILKTGPKPNFFVLLRNKNI